MREHVQTADMQIWVEQAGQGAEVLLIGGLGDTVESWQFQLDGLADSFRLTAFDNRGAGRTARGKGAVSVEMLADDAAAVLAAYGISSAHVAGFSGGSIIAQELAIRHPGLVRSLVLQSTWTVMDEYLGSWAVFMKWLIDAAPSEREFLKGHFLFTYTPRSYNDGTVDRIIDEALVFPHKQSTEDIRAFIDAFIEHDTTDRLPQVKVPTLVLAGGNDLLSRPALCRAVADAIPRALFEVFEGEAHQPFQEIPERWNERVTAFWRSVEQGT